jgi:hypothetical protein
MRRFDELLPHLSNGWLPEQHKYASEFVALWHRHLRVEGSVIQAGIDTLQFETVLSGVRLHGVHNVACLALGGKTDLTQAVRAYWHQVDAAERLVFFLCFTESAYASAKSAVRTQGVLCLTAAQVNEVLQAADARTMLVEHIRRQYPLRQLIPFNFTQPVNPHMFFGRQAELERLRYEPETSFAIAGPGRLGKTSLGKQFHYSLTQEQDARTRRKYHLDFYACEERTPDGVARYLAINIAPSKRSDRIRMEDLTGFLKYQAYKHHGPLELLLDEVDEVCHLRAFEVLTQAARDGLCRLVLCGRGNLFKAVTNEHAPLKGRVEIIRLKPLTEEEASALLCEPLADLGIRLEQPDKLMSQIFQLTGGLPHLLQFYGKRLAALAYQFGSSKVEPHDVEKIRGEFETAQIFIEQLESLPDDQTRRIAHYLITDGRRYFTVPMVQDIAKLHGWQVDYREALELCNLLVIHHVLAWGEEAYQLANRSLGYYARKMRWNERHGKLGSAPFLQP